MPAGSALAGRRPASVGIAANYRRGRRAVQPPGPGRRRPRSSGLTARSEVVAGCGVSKWLGHAGQYLMVLKDAPT